MANAAREGVRVRDRLLAANEKILNDALREVDEALRDHTPETATGAVAEAHRLKAAIILAQANAAKRRADFTRSSVEGHRRRLMLLSGRLAEVAGERDVVRDSGILAALDGLRADVERVDEALAAAESRKRELDATISDLESRSSAARRLADDARAEMEQLRDDDVDLLAADGFESFRRAYEAASSRYEAAVAEAHRLEQGGLSNARIDDSGDFLLGDYVVGSDGGSVTRSRGLKDFRDDRETLTVDLEGLRHQESDLEASISKFEALSDDYARRAEAAAAESQAIRSEAESLFAEFDAGVNDADAAMNDAARKVNTAIASIRNASRAAGDVSRVAGDRLTAASPSRQDASPFKTLSQDKWRVGQANNELAQARITMATILTNRFLQAAADHDFVAFVKRTFELSQADVEGYAQRRNEARDSAIEEARAAASEFERSSQELRSWTVAAQAAAAHELLAILEDPAHRRTALTNYQNAVATRDALPEVRSLLDRIRQLENR
jgi:DNA repair exonuclease SbcCD ATPase subunit